MEYDAFSAGISPGGLRNRQEIKILICYLLTNVIGDLTKKDVLNSLQENNLANYFEINNAFSELLEDNNIHKISDSEVYKTTKSGELISTQLTTTLPISVREKAVKAALELLAKAKRETDNQVTIAETEKGHFVTCNISGGEVNLMSLTVLVPEKMQAELVKTNFQNAPEKIYTSLLALLTKNTDLVENALKNLK